MAQGKIKTKGQVPGKGKNKQRQANLKKHSNPKKGARVIAPKKAKQIQAAKLKKDISKAISLRNEQDIISQASSKEARQLTLSSTSGSGDAKKKKGSK